jgi:hypothetical protein
MTAAPQHACPKFPLYCEAMPINEPDASYAGNFGSAAVGFSLTYSPYSTDNGFNIGQPIIIGEGPNASTNMITDILSSTTYKLHSEVFTAFTAVSATLENSLTGSSGAGGTAKTLEILSTPIATPLPTNIPPTVATNPPTPTSTLELSTVTGFNVGDYITVDCRWKINHSAPIPETVKIQSKTTPQHRLTRQSRRTKSIITTRSPRRPFWSAKVACDRSR